MLDEMRAVTEPPVRAAQLTGWKEIAAHLGRGIRTAQRWEREFGLPVRRIGNDRTESVFAFPAEIDAWLATSSAIRAKRGPANQADDALPESNEVNGADESREPALNGQPPQGPSTPAWSTRVAVGLAVLATIAVLVPLAVLRDARQQRVLAAAPAFVAPGVVVHYAFDEGRGTILHDSKPEHRDGTITNGAWTAGPQGLGAALDFGPGTRSGRPLIALFPGAFPFHAPAADASLAFWIAPADVVHRTVFWTRGDPHAKDENRFHIFTGSAMHAGRSVIGVDYRSPHGVLHPLFEEPIPTLTWTHVVLVRTGQQDYTLYLNGTAAATKKDDRPDLPTYPSDWGLWRTEDREFDRQNGKLDDITLWRRALTPGEVFTLYRQVARTTGVRPSQSGD
jgi:hypothetical protein